MSSYPNGDGWAPPPPRHPVVAQPVQWYASAPVPPALPSRTVRRKRWLLGTVLCALLAIGCGSLTVSRFADAHAPKRAVQQYFAALHSGNAAGALALAASPPRGEYLTDDVLKQQLAIAPLSDVRVDRVDVRGTEATASVDYRLGFHSGTKRVTDSVQLVKHGSDWRLSRVAVSVQLSTTGSGSERLMLAGRPLPTDRQVLVFPGAIPVTSDSAAVEQASQPVVGLSDEDGDDVGLAASVSDSATAQLTKAVSTLLAGCLSGASKDPNCPVPDEARPIPGSLRGKESSGSGPVRAELASSGDGRINLNADVTVHGSWRIWNFNNQAVAKTGSTLVELHAVASISDLNTVYWTVQS